MRNPSTEKKRLLFLGNSATYVNDLPGTLCRLANEAGYPLVCDSIALPSVKTSFHADASTEHGQTVLATIRNGYDIVFLQDNGNCVSSDLLRTASENAYKTLAAAIHASGATAAIYFRPPYGTEKWGMTPFEQCREFDRHFSKIACEIDSLNAYVNRAFAYAIRNTSYDVWGPDHAHTGAYGAYLAVCVFFTAVFRVSATVLGTNGLAPEDACTLQEIADRITLSGETPW